MKRMLITVVAAELLVVCMTPVDYSKPRPLKEGEAKRAKIKHDPRVGAFDCCEENIEVYRGLGTAGRQVFD